MRRLVLVGGSIHETPLLKKQLREHSFDEIIAADSGLNWAYRLGLRPDRMMGDFDSVKPEVLQYYQELGIPSETFPARKDFTDSELALWAAIDESRAGDEIWMLGGIGSRMDHTLANVFMLYEPLKKGIRARLLDGCNEIWLVQAPLELRLKKRAEQQYLSLLPFLGDAEGIDLEGFAYPLHDYTLRMGRSICTSNEFEDETGIIRFKKGYLLVIRSVNDTL